MRASTDNGQFSVLSGRSVVLGMLAFGLIATGVMWAYWHLHTAPFRPLQEAIAREFDDSIPKVDGGQHKMHKQSRRLLRIVMRIPFDPTRDDPRAQQVADRVLELATEHHDLTSYDALELHLYHGVPEREIQQRMIERPLRPAASAIGSSASQPRADDERTK